MCNDAIYYREVLFWHILCKNEFIKLFRYRRKFTVRLKYYHFQTMTHKEIRLTFELCRIFRIHTLVSLPTKSGF